MASEKVGAGEVVLPEELNRIVDKVLAFRPPPKSKAAQKRVAQAVEMSKQKKAAD